MADIWGFPVTSGEDSLSFSVYVWMIIMMWCTPGPSSIPAQTLPCSLQGPTCRGLLHEEVDCISHLTPALFNPDEVPAIGDTSGSCHTAETVSYRATALPAHLLQGRPQVISGRGAPILPFQQRDQGQHRGRAAAVLVDIIVGNTQGGVLTLLLPRQVNLLCQEEEQGLHHL